PKAPPISALGVEKPSETAKRSKATKATFFINTPPLNNCKAIGVIGSIRQIDYTTTVLRFKAIIAALFGRKKRPGSKIIHKSVR
ncbi:MAG: hypothetical protein JW701_05480, partial [Kosmotogaceae bacterium]|nr:hypothetical protein [Kosmotogaceae bacterium]